ncbi:HutD/Ves family protein [Paraburkholderia tropica]|uniref:HutD/Ves family protein n=1 Tax=Paraburkholderia tropica TaxID=92647 RepID=UPI002AB306F2|nr:HutD family protein [Paraburkholderia tropica]
MTAIEVRPLASLAVERWRNGGGVTRTLAADGNRWRISLAEVERNGPYSRFDGISRLSLVLRGNGVTLRDKHTVVMLKAFEAIEYDGAADWNATLIDGPVTALNVMTSKGRYRVKVRAIVEPLVVHAGCTAAVIATHGGCAWHDAPAEQNEGRAIDAGSFLLAESVERPIRLLPTAMTMNKAESPQLPVLVTIESASTRPND